MADGMPSIVMSRFATAREAWSQKATFWVAGCQLEIAAQTVTRARNLVDAAMNRQPGDRSTVMREMARVLREVRADLDEVIAEFECPGR